MSGSILPVPCRCCWLGTLSSGEGVCGGGVAAAGALPGLLAGRHPWLWSVYVVYVWLLGVDVGGPVAVEELVGCPCPCLLLSLLLAGGCPPRLSSRSRSAPPHPSPTHPVFALHLLPQVDAC